MSLVITIFTALANLLLGLLTYVKNPKGTPNKLLAFLTLLFSSWAVFNYLSLQKMQPEDILFWIRMTIFTGAFMGPTIFLLVRAFPHQKTGLSNLTIYFIWGYTILTAFLTISPYTFTKVNITNEVVQPEPGFGILFFAISFLGGSILSFWTLISKFKNAHGLEKVQIRILLFSIIATFTSISITNFLLVNLFHFTSLVVLGPFWTLILVGSISYAIVKHRFLDIGLVVARSVSYTLLLAILALFYALGLFFVGSVFTDEPTTTANLVTSTLLALVMAFTFQPLRRFLERVTDKVFYKEHYYTEELLSDLTRVMASTFELKDLTKRILKLLLDEVRISKGLIVLVDKKKVMFVQSHGYDSDHLPKIFFMEAQSLIGKKHSRGVLVFDELPAGKTKKLLRQRDLRVTMPLITKSGPIGLLALGEKSSGDIYSNQDIQLLKILGPELAIAIQNAQAFDEIKKFNITLRDEVKKATADLQKANERLKQLDKLKDEFLSIAGHELRTPMTAIKSYLWMLLNKKQEGDVISAKTQRYMDQAYQSTERLIALVNDMLDVSRIESGRVEINPEPVNLLDLTKQVMDEVSARAQEGKLELKVEEMADMPQVTADKNKIHQVLLNLIGNSLKFTPEGGKITVSFRRTDGHVLTSVTDTGKGIPKDQMGKLFTKFGRLEGSYTAIATTKGTGLGLYLCKQYVEKMGGKITVESEEGKGATFTFTLPMIGK